MQGDKIPDEIMREAQAAAPHAPRYHTAIARALLARDTAARKECVEIAREAQRMRERLFSENEASINAHRAMQAMEIADAIGATIGGKQG